MDNLAKCINGFAYSHQKSFCQSFNLLIDWCDIQYIELEGFVTWGYKTKGYGGGHNSKNSFAHFASNFGLPLPELQIVASTASIIT
jgi:hypothetical protein